MVELFTRIVKVAEIQYKRAPRDGDPYRRGGGGVAGRASCKCAGWRLRAYQSRRSRRPAADPSRIAASLLE
jgi:hypothetical protein